MTANTVPRRNGRAARIADFLPHRAKTKSPDELLAAVVELNAQLGGTDRRR